MSIYEPGIRVGAILGSKGKEIVEFLGYGTYVGDEAPEGAVGNVAELTGGLFPNPKIELDNGKVVWGCECWWGPEDVIKEKLEDYEVVDEVDIDEIRKEYRAEKELQIEREQREGSNN
jgi:hypothetical protein